MIREHFQVDSVITSPPYLYQRDYEILPSIWDGNPNCEHDWNKYHIKDKRGNGHYTGKTRWQHIGKEAQEKNIYVRDVKKGAWEKGGFDSHFCSKCGAWLGSLGLEPDFNLYIKHLCDIYDLIWQVLKPIGTNWVNLGDSYSSGGRSGSKEYFEKGHKQFGKNDPQGKYQAPKKVDGFPSKCLLMIPQRFAEEMINRGWILRNIIIWYKTNSMPESCKDRFTNNFEYIFFFVKNVKTIYWVNNKTGNLVDKKPLGIHGIENSDWYWGKCKKCLGTGNAHHKCKFCKGLGYYYDIYFRPKICPKCKGKKRIKEDTKCKSCKGLGKKKKNHWNSRDYFFEQQFETSNTEFIYSRNSKKGENQDINNPRKNWGLIKEELEYYNSKYKENDYGQTLQGFIRNQSIKEERELSKVKAKVLYPNNKKKQQEYINYIHDHGLTSHLGRNKRCVWEIPTKPNPESHFATFPDTLIEIPIKAGCPKFICKKCGLPREKIYKKIGELSTNWSIALKKYHKDQRREGKLFSNINDFIGYSDCGCNSGFTSGIVLDPFAGIGTTLLTAWKLGLNYIGFEISKKYCKIANKKLSKTNFKRLDDFIYFESKVINEQEV